MVKPLWCRVLEASSSSSRTVGPGVDTQGYRPYWTNTRTLTLESARCTVLHSCDEETYGVVLVKSCLIYVPVWSQQLECMFLFIQFTELTGEEFHYQKCWCCLATSTFTDAFLVFFLPTSKTSTRPRTSSIVWQSDCGVQQTLLMSLLPCFIYSDASNRLLDAGMNVLGFFFLLVALSEQQNMWSVQQKLPRDQMGLYKCIWSYYGGE